MCSVFLYNEDVLAKEKREMQHWNPGEPLNDDDRAILQSIIDKSHELGRTPTVSEVADAARIKSRFRIWKNAVLAAGLPALNSPEQVRLREHKE